MVRTRRNSAVELKTNSGRISSRTRSSRSSVKHEEPKRDTGNDDASLSDSQIEPPTKRRRRNADAVSNDHSADRSPHNSGPAEEWRGTSRPSRLSTRAGASIQNGHSSLVLRTGSRREAQADGDHSLMNGDSEVRRSGRARRNKFETLNQSLLFDQLVNSTAEAVLQEMDNITSNIRQNRRPGEVERLRMWADTEFENMDMYSRVKRKRKPLRRNMYGMPIHVEETSEGDEEEEEEEEGSEESQEEEEDVDEAEEAEENDRPYNLRQRKAVQRYQAPPIEPVHRRQRQSTLFDTHRSPARRSHIRRKKHAIHSSDTTSSSDEERFERRKSKSMARARNRCLPMNIRAEDLASGILRERVKVGASLADVDPMNIDTSVWFDSIGGLSQHIQALKEMVVFPLLYPEVFERFKIQPPRGCLFYGPPGTGKTLVARALANECGQGDKKVSFFMRKGADCLSKWVGESERQLRLLFDQAYLMRPSIIFFDEIDGLAPVRSSRQDQIHSSIVSTLLALMDGLDNRGEIVIIGATNRLDSIDPALRRPGRFDREFLFNLPDKKARKHIFQIHTRDWNPKLLQPFLEELAEKCVGYCGADIKALCTEAALFALRRRYPQIYESRQKLQLDVSSIVINAQDFYLAMQNIVPASQRAVCSPGQALSHIIKPLLENVFNKILIALYKIFPHAEQTSNENKDADGTSNVLEDCIYSDDEDEAAIFDSISLGSPKKLPPAPNHKPFLHFSMSAHHQPTSHRPRLLLCGDKGCGQTSQLAPALLHSLERFSVHRLDLPALYSVSAKTPEESCAQVFREARRTVPSIIYMPHIREWWDAVSETVKATFITLLQDIPSFSPILIMATSETTYAELPDEIKCIFAVDYGEIIVLQRPGEDERTRFFEDLILNQAAKPPSRKKKAAFVTLEVLQPAQPPTPKQLSEEEQKRMEEQEENTLRELRLFLRDITKRLATDKRFSIFSKPVDIEEVSDYLEVIKQPMDLSTIMTKIDNHKYETVQHFLTDISLICSNALEYNPDKDPGDRIIRHRACTLKDTSHAIVAAELDPEFNKLCEDIRESRRKRGISPINQQTYNSATAKREDSAHDSSHILEARTTNGECKHTIQIKRKPRRRSKWGRGIIKKSKKVNHLKKDDFNKSYEADGDQGEESELAENGELEVSTDYPEENGDLSLTNDESSCDIMDVNQMANKLENGTANKESVDVKPTGKEDCADFLSDGNNEFPLTKEKAAPEEQCVPNDACSAGKRLAPTECTWSDESMASAESEPSQECLAGGVYTPNDDTIPGKDDLSDAKLEPGKECEPIKASMIQLVPNAKIPVVEKDRKHLVEESSHSDTHPTQPDIAVKCSQNEDIALKGLESEKDVLGGVKQGQPVQAEQQTVVHMEQVLEDILEPIPPLIVDHTQLKHFLQLAVKKSNNFTVDQLEKLYSLLSQCIYRHRKEYDKSCLLEEMENLLNTFQTFL